MAKLALYDVLPESGLSTSVSADVMEAVGERLLVLEHLCPISDPARQTLDGTWQVLYCNTTMPGLIAYRVLQSLPFPPGVATLEELKLNIAGHTLTVVAKIKLLDMVAELDLVSSLTPESDIRIRETYEKGALKLPEMGSEGMMDDAALKLKETPMPENLIQQALTRATPMLQSLSEGFEVPLAGTFDRSILVSYLDKDLMVARSLNGSPEVLRKLSEPASEEPKEAATVEEEPAAEQQQQQEEKEEEVVVLLEPKSPAPPNNNPSPPPSV